MLVTNTQETAPVAFTVAGRPIYLHEPTDGQMLFIVMAAGISPDEPFQESVDSLKSFFKVIGHLVVDPSTLDGPDEETLTFGQLRSGLERGEIQLEDYVGLAEAVVKHWGNPEEIEENRAARRRAPAKKTTASARRTKR